MYALSGHRSLFRVIVGTSGSPGSPRALRYAEVLACGLRGKMGAGVPVFMAAACGGPAAQVRQARLTATFVHGGDPDPVDQTGMRRELERRTRESWGDRTRRLPSSQFSPRTVWARRLETPLRRFLRTETGSAAVLLAATLVALAWANIDPAGYAATWHTVLMIRSGTTGLADSWQGWVNSGLMAFFWWPAGGAPRVRPGRAAGAAAAGAAAGGRPGRDDRADRDLPGHQRRATVSVRLGHGHVHRHGIRARRTGPGRPGHPGPGAHLPAHVRADHVAGIVVIALAYSGHIDLTALAAGVAILGRGDGGAVLAGCPQWPGLPAAGGGGLGRVLRVRGVDPVVVGLAMRPARGGLPRRAQRPGAEFESLRLSASSRSPSLARDARESVRLAISPNDRLQQLFHPWTSYLIVPLFALANAGITVSGSFLARAYTSPVTSGSCSATWQGNRPGPSLRPGC